MTKEIKILGQDIPDLILQLNKIQKEISKFEEIRIKLESHPVFEELLDLMIDISLQLANLEVIVPIKLNPQIQEPEYIEEDFSTPTHLMKHRVVGSLLPEFIPVAKFSYDKLPDGTVNLERQEIDLKRIKVDPEVQQWFTWIAETAAQIKEGIKSIISSQIREKTRISLPRNLIPKRNSSSEGKNKRKKKQSIANKAYHTRKSGKLSAKRNKNTSK